MRLIDADKLRHELIMGHDLIGAKYTDMADTVKAIPIEWLKRLQGRYLEAECNMSVCVINEILNLWEKEMRLIDADKITFFDCLSKSGNDICCHAKGITCKEGIDIQPTVKAIPIEWIKVYTRKSISDADYWAMIRMVLTWKSERKQTNDD